MKWLAIPLSLWLLAACGNDNNDEVTDTPENAPLKELPIITVTLIMALQDNKNDTNGEGATNNGSTTGNNTVTNANNNSFDFTHFSLDVDYSEAQDFDVEYENEQSGVEASYEDNVNNEQLYGNDAYDRLESVFQSFKFDKNTSDDEVISEVLKAFNLPEDYQKFDLEVRFADGTEKEYHKGNQGQ